MKPVGKPDAGNPHVRFDERGGETGRESDTAPFLDSTVILSFLLSFIHQLGNLFLLEQCGIVSCLSV
jgi:hypothetical protein